MDVREGLRIFRSYLVVTQSPRLSTAAIETRPNVVTNSLDCTSPDHSDEIHMLLEFSFPAGTENLNQRFRCSVRFFHFYFNDSNNKVYFRFHAITLAANEEARRKDHFSILLRLLPLQVLFLRRWLDLVLLEQVLIAFDQLLAQQLGTQLRGDDQMSRLILSITFCSKIKSLCDSKRNKNELLDKTRTFELTGVFELSLLW